MVAAREHAEQPARARRSHRRLVAATRRDGPVPSGRGAGSRAASRPGACGSRTRTRRTRARGEGPAVTGDRSSRFARPASSRCARRPACRGGRRSGPSPSCWPASCTTSSAAGSKRSRTPTTRSTRTPTRAPSRADAAERQRRGAAGRRARRPGRGGELRAHQPDDLGRAFVEESLMKVRLEADFDDFEPVVFYRRGERHVRGGHTCSGCGAGPSSSPTTRGCSST